jgi:5-methylcytosine-specific restriction endonuclease McrA
MGHDTLVLDMTGVPVGFIGWQKAVKLYWEDRATIVDDDSERILHSPSFEMNMPTVIRAKNWVRRRRKTAVPFSRRNIAIRDNSECQYCGKELKTSEFTLDHVVPRVQGGISSWVNLVVSCIRCNKRKAGCTPHQAGMKLLRTPVEPKVDDPKYNFKLHIKRMRPEWKEWETWLYWNVELDK